MNESDIFMAALDRSSPEERVEFLDSACGDNRQLRQRVETLLAAHSAAGSLLDHPAIEDISTQLPAEGSTQRLPEWARESRKFVPDDDISLDFLESSPAPDSLGRLGQ